MVNRVGRLAYACEAANCVVRSRLRPRRLPWRWPGRGARANADRRHRACAPPRPRPRRRAHRRLHHHAQFRPPARRSLQGVAYALRGLAYLDRGDIAHAIADLNQAVALAPDFAPAYQNRGNAWYARGNFGQAIADYDETIKLDPNSPSPYVNRATVRRDLGYTDGALEDYQKAIEPRATAAPTPIAGAGRSICASRTMPAPSPISTARCDWRRTPTITCCAAQGARRSRRSRPRAARLSGGRAARSEKRRALTAQGRDLAQEGQSRQGARRLRPRGARRPEASPTL